MVDICNVFCDKLSMNGEEIYREIGGGGSDVFVRLPDKLRTSLPTE